MWKRGLGEFPLDRLLILHKYIFFMLVTPFESTRNVWDARNETPERKYSVTTSPSHVNSTLSINQIISNFHEI